MSIHFPKSYGTTFTMRMIAVFVIWFIGVGVYCTAKAYAQPNKIKVYFYSSETNINNYKWLKTTFDSYLSTIGDYEFQPFEKRDDFEHQIQHKDRCLILVSSWHYRMISKIRGLKPVLVGVQNGKYLQKRFLIAGKKSSDIQTALKGIIASSCSQDYTRMMLQDMLPDNQSDSLKILTVPKDVDALMCVGFNQAKAALATETALTTMQAIDPYLFNTFKLLAESKESLMMIVAAPEAYVQEMEKLITALKNMPNESLGMNLIKILNLDGWKPIEPADKLQLDG